MDLTQIQTVLGLATSAVGLTGQATATVEAVKKAFGGKSGEASSEVQQLLNNLATQLTSANMMNLQLSAILKDIGAQIEKEQRFEQRLSRYELTDTGHGELIFSLRSEHMHHPEPPHYVCPICIEKDRRFHFVTGPDNDAGKSCQGCNHYFPFRPMERKRMIYSGF